MRFGPSGIESQIQVKSTEEVASLLESNGLDAFEYSFTYGVRISDEKAISIGKAFAEHGISLSVHAPYYINFASSNPEQVEKSIDYILQCIAKMRLMNSNVLVFHSGSLTGLTREQAFLNVKKNLVQLLNVLDEKQIYDIFLCPETMGKHGQVGSVEEIAEICSLDKRFMPTLDFGHINAFSLGGLKNVSDFQSVFDIFKNKLGSRFKNVHIHFSKIEYGNKGELKHLNLDDTTYGPDFELLAPVLVKNEIFGNVICESREKQFSDSIILKNLYKKFEK